VTDVEDAECLGHPLASKTDERVVQVGGLVLENRRITICEVVNVMGNKSGPVQSFLKESLNMCWIATKFMPCLLSDKQKSHVNMSQDLQGGLIVELPCDFFRFQKFKIVLKGG
jgi:hypothetical protein